MKKLFTDHPSSVGETYFEHMANALRFGAALAVAATACAVHAFLPFFFKTTGSRIIVRVHDRMVVNRRQKPAPTVAAPGRRDAT